MLLKMVRLAAILLFGVFSSEISSLTLTSSSDRVRQEGTPNFTMTCEAGGENAINSSGIIDLHGFDIHRIRILKYEDNLWNTLAEMDSDWEDPQTPEGVTGFASIAINTSETSNLSLVWSFATNTTGGHYACDALGYATNDKGFWYRSPTLHIDVEIPESLFDLYEMIKESKNKMEDMGRKLSETKKSFDTLRSKMVNAETKMNQFNQSVDDLIDDIDRYHRVWPQGTYGLFKPQTGCPENFGVTWKSGYRKHHTESTEGNSDHVSRIAHMSEPILEKSFKDNFIYQRFCVVTRASWERQWPKGSYCINRKYECPHGFSNGEINWDEEDTNWKGIRGNETVRASGGYLYYCCRNDSNPLIPIRLPNTKPFYLYRKGGTCQQVVGMKVTPEYIFFDDQCCAGGYYNAAPDGKEALPDKKLELCYYEEA